ncbi:MAG: carbon-nitrogen hydrolase family protein [Salinivirgaceae bacterium]|jgi:predicted amidohydrolase|nr:carbon-nitrogen hydrolase family protein [Salinivirgaceae bacterium]
MILAAAQFDPTDGSIDKNLGYHYNLIDLAYTHKAQLIVFPEMSITGYVRERAPDYAFVENDKRLSELRKLARDYRMVIIAGAPIRIGEKLHIASFVLLPDNSVKIYTKHFLHKGEEVAFESSKEHNPLIKLNGEEFSLAICFDIENKEHLEAACKNKSTFYVPSLFYTNGGIEGGHETLGSYAKKYKMNVLMSNFCGKSYGLDAGGRSAFWDNKGSLVESLDEDSQGLLLVERNDNGWKGTSIFTNYE